MGVGEHDNQFNCCRRIIVSQYPKYRHAFIYLSPDGRDPERWCAMSRRNVSGVIEAAKAKT